MSRQERSRWRFTFQRLVADATEALLSQDGVPAGAAAVEELIDLAREAHDYHYFHSEDPVEAARFVVSDAAALLWSELLDEYGFAGFAERAAPRSKSARRFRPAPSRYSTSGPCLVEAAAGEG